jgi:beta-1,4-mannosyltransferase
MSRNNSAAPPTALRDRVPPANDKDALDAVQEVPVSSEDFSSLANGHTSKSERSFVRIPSYRIDFWLFVLLFVVISGVTLAVSPGTSFHPLNIYLTVVWSLYLPIAVIGLAGGYQARKLTPSTFNDRVDEKVIFIVPTVGRRDVAGALRRVIDSILIEAPSLVPNMRVDVVLEADAEILSELEQLYGEEPRVRLLVVPRDYVTPNGSLFKARANQYALDVRTEEGESREDVFVYHLDDDTSIGPDTIASIAEFISQDDGTTHLAQGVLVFPHQLSASRFCSLADAVRPADDLTRFYFFAATLRRPLGGLHGEHMLVRASVEADLGWDFGPRATVEDSYFALELAKRYPKSTAFLSSSTYGASPDTVKDLIRQRRRWAAGLYSLAVDRRYSLKLRGVLLYSVFNWSIGPLQHVAVVLTIGYLVGALGTSPVWAPIAVLWSVSLASHVWRYLIGLRSPLSQAPLRSFR